MEPTHEIQHKTLSDLLRENIETIGPGIGAACGAGIFTITGHAMTPIPTIAWGGVVCGFLGAVDSAAKGKGFSNVMDYAAIGAATVAVIYTPLYQVVNYLIK